MTKFGYAVPGGNPPPEKPRKPAGIFRITTANGLFGPEPALEISLTRKQAATVAGTVAATTAAVLMLLALKASPEASGVVARAVEGAKAFVVEKFSPQSQLPAAAEDFDVEPPASRAQPGEAELELEPPRVRPKAEIEDDPQVEPARKVKRFVRTNAHTQAPAPDRR